MLEDFLEKIKRLTPIQTSRQNYRNFKFYKKENFQILKETKMLHKREKIYQKHKLLNYQYCLYF